MSEIEKFLASMNLPPRDEYELPTSNLRFTDGAQYRIEIPSSEAKALTSHD